MEKSIVEGQQKDTIKKMEYHFYLSLMPKKWSTILFGILFVFAQSTQKYTQNTQNIKKQKRTKKHRFFALFVSRPALLL